jgi:hypothetical protein
VIANVHPVKNADSENLIPAGGGSFLNQVDGNLTTAKCDNTTQLHWLGKFRGVEFAPMHFMLRTVTHERLKDSKGRTIPTVICDCISDKAKDDLKRQQVSEQDRLLRAIKDNPQASQSELASQLEWLMFNREPNKVKVGRHIRALKATKLIKESRSGNYYLTDAGHAVLRGEN